MIALATLIGICPSLGYDLYISGKILHYSGPKSEIYSNNFLQISSSPASYAFTYSTNRKSYFSLILKDNSLLQLNTEEEHPLIAYKTYGSFLVVISHVNPSMNEFYIYDSVRNTLRSSFAGDLIIVDGKVVSLVYPSHFSTDKKCVRLNVNDKEVMVLPFAYYSIEKAGTDKVRINNDLDSMQKIDLDQTTIEVDTSIVVTI